MGHVIRLLLGIALVAGSGALSVRAADAPAEKKEESKVPQIAGANPAWDLKSVEEKFTVIKAGIADNGAVYFLLELKEDMKSTPPYRVEFIDAEGVKYLTTAARCDPNTGKKEDRVRLVFHGYFPATDKAVWAKAVTVKVIEE